MNLYEFAQKMLPQRVLIETVVLLRLLKLQIRGMYTSKWNHECTRFSAKFDLKFGFF